MDLFMTHCSINRSRQAGAQQKIPDAAKRRHTAMDGAHNFNK
jgi:hypothetical protein